MTRQQLEQLDLSWDIEDGFFGQLRQGNYDEQMYLNLISLLRSISFKEEAVLPRRAVSLLWYIPSFMEWQRERVQKAITMIEYDKIKTETENELERILGIP